MSKIQKKRHNIAKQDLIDFTETTRQRKQYMTPSAWELNEINIIGKLTIFFHTFD